MADTQTARTTQTTEIDQIKQAFTSLHESFVQLRAQYDSLLDKYKRVKAERDDLIKAIQSTPLDRRP